MQERCRSSLPRGSGGVGAVAAAAAAVADPHEFLLTFPISLTFALQKKSKMIRANDNCMRQITTNMDLMSVKAYWHTVFPSEEFLLHY